MKRAHMLAIVPVLGMYAHAQTNTPVPVTGSMGSSGTISAYSSVSARVRRVSVVTGAPYSAEQVTEHTQTLSDGTHIAEPSKFRTLMYRDSQGRTRVERQMHATMIEIIDPVEGYSYRLDTENKTAHRTKVEVAGLSRTQLLQSVRTVMPAPPPNMQQDATRPHPVMKEENLGTQMIDGIQAEGHRNTMTWPVGSMGNDRPIVSTSELWIGIDLKVPVLSKNTDPRSGESTTKLINSSRAEPDPALFQPPADYSIVDEKPLTAR